MVVLERSLANTSFLFNLSIYTNVQETANNMATNIEIDLLGIQSKFKPWSTILSKLIKSRSVNHKD